MVVFIRAVHIHPQRGILEVFNSPLRGLEKAFAIILDRKISFSTIGKIPRIPRFLADVGSIDFINDR